VADICEVCILVLRDASELLSPVGIIASVRHVCRAHSVTEFLMTYVLLFAHCDYATFFK